MQGKWSIGYRERHTFGITFLINRKYKQAVMNFEAVDARVCSLRMRGNFNNFTVILVCAPNREKNKLVNPLTPKDPYSGRTAPLTSKRCILYIYSTNTGTEYFKHGIYCPFFFSLSLSLFKMQLVS